MRRSGVAVVLAFALSGLAAPQPGLAWGSTGHRLIGRLAMAALPSDLPGFLRTAQAIDAVDELAREPDRWKSAGWVHDSDRDPAHFLDVDDAGKVLGGPSLSDLPSSRQAFETALRAAGADEWRSGYLPYAIVDGAQQLAKDFSYWRAETAAARTVTDRVHRAWMVKDSRLRESLIIRDLGVLAHYVGDGSQPLHVSVHFNGWGAYPNPDGFTQNKIHAYFEGDFVHDFVSESAVRADMIPYRDCYCRVEARAAAYLEDTNAQVAPLYRLEKEGAFTGGDARGRVFVARRLAAGADELRDEVIDAWRASLNGVVGFPSVKVADVLAGKADPYEALYGVD